MKSYSKRSREPSGGTQVKQNFVFMGFGEEFQTDTVTNKLSLFLHYLIED